MGERLRAIAEPVQQKAPTETATLRRRCACGDCAACRDDEATLQKRGNGQASTLGRAPAQVKEVLRSSGRPLDIATRQKLEPRFGHDFSQVRIHTDMRAAQSARQVHAHAYTVGRDVVFAEGRYSPHTTKGMELLAHELSHTVQQKHAVVGDEIAVGEANAPAEREADRMAQASGAIHAVDSQAVLRRDPDDLTTRSASQIMADPLYLDNHLKSMRFYDAQLAVITYDDGSQLRLGLTPEWIKSPIEGVDYRTLRSQHIPIMSGEPGKMQYIPRGAETLKGIPDDTKLSLQDALLQYTRTVTFARDTTSNRIVPTQVNSITAPNLCTVLREAEAEFVKNFDAMAAGGKKVFESMKTVVELLMVLDAAAGIAEGATARGAAKVGTVATAEAEATLTRKFMELLAKKGAGEVTVGGVAFGDIQVAMEGTELVIRRTFVQNVSRIPNQGKVMQSVWEAAAIKAAQQAGAKSVQVALRTVVNATWKAYLESQGYTWQTLPKLFGEFGVEGALTKTITL
jgi:hypothetical protein